MKRYSSILFATLLLASSCVDHRYDYVVDDSAYFAKSDLQEETLSVMNAQDYVYEIWIHKSGYHQEKFAANLELDYNYLVQYNSENSTNHEMLGEEYYSFEREFEIPEGKDEVSVPLILKTELLLQDKGYGTYYIPLSVNSRTPEKEIYLEKSHFMLALTLQRPSLKIDGRENDKGEYIGDIAVDANTVSEGTYEIDITSLLDVITTEDLEVLYKEDETLLKENEHKLDAQYYSYSESVLMPKEEQYAENYLKVNLAEMPDGKWTVPVRMSTSNGKVSVPGNKSWIRISIVKGSIDKDISCIGEYAQGNEIIVKSDDILNGEVIANTNGRDMSYTVIDNSTLESPTWMSVNIDGNDVKLSIFNANPLSYKEQLATITLIDNNTLLEKVITVRQCISDYGIVLNKKLWSAELYNDYGIKVGGSTPSLEGLFDNKWSTGANNKLYVEFSKVNKEKGVSIIFDLGENPHAYTHLGLLPRLEWVAQSPKYVKIDYSDDKQTWIEGKTLTGFEETVLKGGGSSWLTDQYDCELIKWFEINDAGVSSRYVRVTVIDSFWSSGSYISFDEFFISDKK